VVFAKAQLFFQKHKRLILSLVIFLLPLLILGIPFYKWGFVSDDIGGIWYAKVDNWQNMFRFFYEGSEDNPHVVGPSSLTNVSAVVDFFGLLYRPLSYVLLTLQLYFFDLSAYAFLLFIVFFHSINGVILFNIFLSFFTIWVAFIGSSFFVFHASLFRWMGIIGCQKYTWGLTLLFLAIWLLKKYYLDFKKLRYYFLSCLVILFSFFLMEHLLVMPFWVFCAIYFYQDTKKQQVFFWERIKESLRISSGYFIALFFYLTLRFIIFPVRLPGEGKSIISSILVFLTKQADRFFDYLTYVVGLLNLGWMPGGNQALKGLCLVLISIFLIYPFFKTKRLKLFIFFLLSIILFSWPVFYLTYMPRYIYIVLPFFVSLFAFSFDFYIKKYLKLRPIIFTLVGMFLACNALYLFIGQTQKEQKLNLINLSFQDLVEMEEVENRVICFVALPNDYFGSSNRQAVWLYGNDSSKEVFYDRNNFIPKMPDENKDYLKIEHIKNGLRFKSLDCENFNFRFAENGKSLLGEIIINKVNQQDKVCDIDYIFDPRLLEKEPLFVTWDYENQKFLIIK
jgi:hypothetical protein